MSGKHLAFSSIGCVFLVGIVWYVFSGPSRVRGQVSMDGNAVAAGRIVFESDQFTLSAPISDGFYEIEQPRLAGNYKVRVQIHFADASEARDFYENMTNEINKNSGADAEDLSSIESYTFDVTLTNGSNTKNFRIGE